MDEKSKKWCFLNYSGLQGNEEYLSPVQGEGLPVDDVLQGHVRVLHVAGTRPVLRNAVLLKTRIC